MVLDRADRAYVVGAASLVREDSDVGEDLARSLGQGWSRDRSNPFLVWVAGNYVESDRPNRNRQYWTAGDLEVAEYTIKYAPLNMVHKTRTPVGFFAETRVVPLQRRLRAVGDGAGAEDEAARKGPLKIQVLAGMWSHIFPFETALMRQADEAGKLFLSMECRGSHLVCGGDQGCGKKFAYAAVDTHCEHLRQRTSTRHIVSPVFRGGALIVPPVQPGWAQATATQVADAVMSEAAVFAEENEAAYQSLGADGSLTATGWERLMAMVLASGAP